MPENATRRRSSTLDDLFRFRVAPTVKARFTGIAEELGLTPSLLLRKFVFAVVERPEIADRMMALHRSGSTGVDSDSPHPKSDFRGGEESGPESRNR